MNSIATPYFRKLLFSVVLLLSCITTRANHIVGVDLFYTWISGNTYKVTLVAYGNCGSGGSGTSFESLPTNNPQVYVYNGNSLVQTLTLTIQPPAAGVEITPVCPAEISHTQCTNLSFAIPGIKKFVYTANVTLPGTSSVWRFLFTGAMTSPLSFIAGRALSITNISGTSVIQLCDTLNNTVTHNSSPNMTSVPTPYFCLSNDDNYNPGAVDPDGDSLRFELVTAMNGTSTSSSGTPVAYIPPFTATDPLAVTTMTFDHATGQISFFPDELQRSLVVYNIREYHNGVLIGTCQREMTFLVQTCTNTPPSGVFSGASGGTVVDGTHFNICQNSGSFTLNINPTEAVTSNNITVTTTGLPSGLTFTTTGNGTPTPHCTIAWTSTGVAAGSYTFYVTYTDNNCPLSGTQTIAYTVSILPQPTVSTSTISAATCNEKGTLSIVPGGGGGPWIIKVSNATTPFDTIQSFTGVTTSFADSLVPGAYTVTVRTSGAGCKASAAVTIAPPTFLTPTATFTNPTYCGANDGTITLHGLIPGSNDTIKYKKNGVVQPSLVLLVSATGEVVLSGLTSGTYSSITATYGRYCVSGAVGPIVLANPPFTVRTVTSTNPSYCGTCNGTMTLYGLHPGQMDTITFKKDGITQPPVVQFIGSDSMVVISGLCSGVYSAIVAKTAGGCTSSPFGPITLTVPPFTIRAVSFTNPPYCGICTGTITIYGAHPGQTDTITYTKDGIPQAPVVATIGSDSTVTITGLCAGVYANIVAHTGGVCVSNVLGPVTLTVPPFTMRAISFVNPPYCGICTGKITLYGLHPGQTDTITYNKDGVPQTPVVHVIGSDSTVVINGLCAGVYSDFVAHTGGVCATTALGPVTLTVPPFTMRALSFTNPPYCGICTGTITLYGLHPGQTDTITYKKDGVSQPAVVHFIGPDSTVVITGLCAGLYTEFVAHTGGVCVSNILGPANLTVPPFTMRALDSTNPDYCGICNGTITIYGLHPGQTDTITYSKDGIPQPPFIHFIGPDSTAVITNLCAGLYTAFVAHTGGVCVSNTLGPINLTVPPFTMRAIARTNPTKCGFCDGIIKLYGLHPGQTDTITYTRNGVAQTPVVHVIGPDSMITITDLCKGHYADFVAHTGGVCISNILGPVDLVDPPIIPAFTFVTTENCKGDTVQFNNGSSPASDLTYTWTFGDSAISWATNPSHVYHLPGTYPVKLVITNTKCFDSIVHPVTLNNLVKAGFVESPDSFVCTGNPVTFTNKSLGTELEYLWDYGDGQTGISMDATHIYDRQGTYHITMALSNYVPCRDTARAVIVVDSISSISIAATDSVLCGGHTVTFTGLYTPLGNTGMKWTFGNGTSLTDVNPVIHAFEDSGTFSIRLDAFYRACPDTFAFKEVYIFPYPSISLGPDTSICPGSNPIQLMDTRNANNPAARWLWNTGERTPGISVGAPGYYSATVTIHGCHATDSVWVQKDCYLDLPNAFSPNGDGANDYFLPRPLLARGLTEFKMSIFNRWGQLVFETVSLEGQGWDGRLNGKEQPEGVYVYMIDATFKDGQIEHHQGNLTLLR